MAKNDFKFFKQEAEDEEKGIKISSASELIDPMGNSSGSYNLDYNLVTPFPEGGIIEIFGTEGSCKTTLALEVAGNALVNGKKVLYVNMERSLNRSLMLTIRSLRPFLDKALEKNASVDDCQFWIVTATTGEGAFETIRKFVQMYPKSIAILDSVDASQPEAVMSEEVGTAKMGNLGKLLSDAMRKMVDPLAENKSTLILINQIRDKMNPYGDPKETSGGRAIKFYAHQRIELMKPGKAQQIVDEASGEVIGKTIRYKIIKNKLAPDGQESEFPILIKNGIFREQELIKECLNFGILKFGGKGGKQVLMPDKDKEFVAMPQLHAAKRLLLNKSLSEELAAKFNSIVKPGSNDPVADMLAEDEVQNT